MSTERPFPGLHVDDLPPCHRCGREQAVREHWRTVPVGGRPDLCWDSGDGLCLQMQKERESRHAPESTQFGLFAPRAA